MILPVDPKLYAAFLGVMAVMAVTPGPANLFAVATGASRGKGAALLGVLGMNVATLVWFGAAALGLGAMITAFPEAFAVIAVLGGLYVAWLGVRTIRAALAPRPGIPPPSGHDEQMSARISRRRSALIDGFMVQIANPKAVLFFTAVLPPFLDAARPLVAQLSLFAAATIGMDVVAMSAYGLGGAALSARMTRARFRKGFDLMVGALLLAASALILLRGQGVI